MTQRLDDAEARYLALAQACDEAVIVCIAESIVFVNDAAVELLGAGRPDQLTGRPLTDFVLHESDEEQPAPAADSGDFAEGKIRRVNGSAVAVSLIRVPCRYDARDALQVVIRDIASRHQLEMQLRFMSRHDPLTELPNRAEFIDRLEGAMARARRSSRQVAVMLLNLDGFKAINTRLGADAGDRMLRIVAERLKESVRKADSVARVAGDEFALILEAVDQRDQSAVVANRVLSRIGDPMEHGGTTMKITASAGVAAYPADAGDLDALLRMAEVAMYAAKENGRGTFRFYFPELEAMSQREQQRRERTAALLETLTDRERQVMDLLLDGNSNNEISAALGASPRTIEKHRARVMEKMQANSLPDLVRKVIELR